MIRLCTDIGYKSLYKNGEQLCGDHVQVAWKDENLQVAVLADGLGSGVKASILSTLTSTILSTMLRDGLSIEECVETMVATLPICDVRKIAYSTFTVICIRDNREAEIIQYDNPHVILLRDGVHVDYPETEMMINGKRIYRSRIPIQKDDFFIMMSDGVINAGSEETLNHDWERDDVISFMELMYNSEFTAKTMATILTDECNRLYDEKPYDDTTVCVVKIRERTPVNLMIGPPQSPEDVPKMMSLFFSKEGKRIVCGGTTSSLAAEYLGKPIISEKIQDPEIPPTSQVEGIDLVTEGVITISKVLYYAQNYLQDNETYTQWSYKKDGASLIARMLFEEGTDLNFFVGRAVNQAHKENGETIGFNMKMHLVEQLVDCLRSMGKQVKVNYF